MKSLGLFLAVASFIFTGCKTKHLEKEEALKLIRQEYHYPKTVDFDIFCGDPTHARRMLDTGLEEKGLVVIRRTREFMDTDPWITFTEKAKPYLLPTAEKDKKYHIQKVRIATEDIVDVRVSELADDQNRFTVEYTTLRSDLTPFAEATPWDNKKKFTNQVYVVPTTDGWMIQKGL